MSFPSFVNSMDNMEMHSAKYYTDCFLKYHKWTLQQNAIEKHSTILVKHVLADCIENYDRTTLTQNISWSPMHLAALLNEVSIMETLILEKGVGMHVISSKPLRFLF